MSRRDDEARCRQAEDLLGHTFEDRALLLRALTHRSYINESDAEHHNERLEFLGDAVLSLVTSERLMGRFPDADEGELTRRRALYVSEGPLAAAGRRVELGALLRLGRGQAAEGGADHAAIIADAVEALLGAVYLDGGIGAAATAVFALLGELPERVSEVKADPKTELQELVQRLVHDRPSYETSRAEGPDHAPRFNSRAVLGERVLGEGEGSSKKDATRAAARRALERLRALSDAEVLDVLKE
jgi:ribonuclease-3